VARTAKACATYVQYIAESFTEQLANALQTARFFSVQKDGSNDAANIEKELYLAVYCDPQSKDGEVHIFSRFVGVVRPKSVDAEGLMESFIRAMNNGNIVN
jgi:hypothetical protein